MVRKAERSWKTWYAKTCPVCVFWTVLFCSCISVQLRSVGHENSGNLPLDSFYIMQWQLHLRRGFSFLTGRRSTDWNDRRGLRIFDHGIWPSNPVWPGSNDPEITKSQCKWSFARSEADCTHVWVRVQYRIDDRVDRTNQSNCSSELRLFLSKQSGEKDDFYPHTHTHTHMYIHLLFTFTSTCAQCIVWLVLIPQNGNICHRCLNSFTLATRRTWFMEWWLLFIENSKEQTMPTLTFLSASKLLWNRKPGEETVIRNSSKFFIISATLLNNVFQNDIQKYLRLWFLLNPKDFWQL